MRNDANANEDERSEVTPNDQPATAQSEDNLEVEVIDETNQGWRYMNMTLMDKPQNWSLTVPVLPSQFWCTRHGNSTESSLINQ